ncbi:unnamed protein product [Closterium sp. NIES-53]
MWFRACARALSGASVSDVRKSAAWVKLAKKLCTPSTRGSVMSIPPRERGSDACAQTPPSYTSADKLSTHAIPCFFLGFPPDAPRWQFYHPTSRRVFPSQDVTFDESVPFYHLFPYRSAPPPPPPLFLAPSPPLVAVDLGATRGTASGGAASKGAEPVGAESEGAGFEGAEPGGAEPAGVEPGGTESEGAESGRVDDAPVSEVGPSISTASWTSWRSSSLWGSESWGSEVWASESWGSEAWESESWGSETLWDEQTMDGASEEAEPLPYCSVPVLMDDENPCKGINAEVYYDFANNGYVTPQPVNTNVSECIGPNFIPDLEAGDEAVYPEDPNLPRYTQSGLRILGLVTGVHGAPMSREPATVQQALGGEHREKWCEAMDGELKALEDRNTWKIVPIGVTRNKTVLTGKWVSRVKTKANGTIDKFKARWVVRGFDQEHGRDFTETFVPVSRHTSLQILLAIAAMKRKKLCQID